MKTNILTIIITTVVGIILLSSLLMPVIDSPGVTKEKVVGTNDNALYYIDTDYSEGLELEISNGIIVNGTQMTPTDNPGLNLFSDKFTTLWWKSQTSANMSDVDLGVIKNVSKITINADGTYSYTKTDSTVVESTGAISWLFYPSTTGDYGYFTSAINVDLGEKWYSTTSAIGDSPWYYLVLNMACDQDGIDVTQHYVATSSSAPFTEQTITVEYTDYMPTISSDGLSYIVSNPNVTRTITVSDTDYTYTGTLGPIVAPLEYHYYQEMPVESSLLGVLPVLIVIALLLGVVREIVIRHND